MTAGAKIIVGQGMTIDVLHPPAGLVPHTIPRSNDNCIVLKLTKAEVSILLTGDIEEAGLAALLQTHPSLRAAVLKVPHHGSRLGRIGEEFFSAVRPQLAIISVGRLHHLPSAEIMDALQHSGARLALTRDDGMVSLRTDGHRLEMRTVRHANRWQQVDRISR